MTVTRILGIDLDDTVLDYRGYFRAFCQGPLGLELPPHDPIAYDFTAAGWFATNEAYREAHAAAVRAGIFRSMEFLPGAQEGLRALRAMGWRPVFATNRFMCPEVSSLTEEDTMAWYNEHDDLAEALIITTDKSAAGAHIYLDDSPHNIEALQVGGYRPIIFSRGHNLHLPGERVASWEEFVALLATVPLPD